MQTFIEIFNANRHWILPLILAGVVGMLVRELKIFFLPPRPVETSPKGGHTLFSLSGLTRKARPVQGALRKPAAGKAAGKPQWGGAALFYDATFDGMK